MSTLIVIILAVLVLLVTLGFVWACASVAGAIFNKLWPHRSSEQREAEAIRALLAEIEAEDATLAARAASQRSKALRRSHA
ncbi:hypothetical protein [Variovorax sp. YR216]|uniref:hypothetical protein n=1 Tax=Variovorax sp. YR216 TaxID=1882828 RepID=UPI000896E5C7|nr:hypothetical protein [Variovorax sp. YR216]SEA50303.1 hypothetical protein SAMN05444680_102676 [Variovorax sp. YR216]